MSGRSIIALAAVLAACCTAGCKEKLQQGAQPLLEGDELVIASSLRRHMNLHISRAGRDYKYIYITVLDADPSRMMLDYFRDFSQQVRPGSELVEKRHGLSGQPPTRGVFVRFAVTEFERISEGEALVTCKTFEFEKEHPGIKYRMVSTGGRWEAASVAGIEDKKLLQ